MFTLLPCPCKHNIIPAST